MAAISTVSRGVFPLVGAFAAALALAGCNESVSPGRHFRPATERADRPLGLQPPPRGGGRDADGRRALRRCKASSWPISTPTRPRNDVALTDSAGARYLARGYISAFLVEGGARLTYVWDIYDRTNHRAQRLNDEIALRGAAADPWSLVDSARARGARRAQRQRTGRLSLQHAGSPRRRQANRRRDGAKRQRRGQGRRRAGRRPPDAPAGRPCPTRRAAIERPSDRILTKSRQATACRIVHCSPPAKTPAKSVQAEAE